MELEYKQLRLEFNRVLFKRDLEEKLGKTCCNCGSNLDVEYHHIVPLALGGTNKITNIVPLCGICHSIVHGKKNIRNIKRSENNGRPRRTPPQGYEYTLDRYIDGEIGTKECKEILGLTKSAKINDVKYYKEYLKSRKIVRFRTYHDVQSKNRKRNKNGILLSKVEYEDGTVIEHRSE